MDEKVYLEPNQVVESKNYPFTIGQMRHFLLMRHKNGLQKAVFKIGKRIYLRQDLFEAWISSQQEGGNE